MLPEVNQVINVNIDSVIPSSSQPRKIFNPQSLNELASSIKIYGIINPIVVRKKNDKYEIIAGERRYRAAKMVGLKTIPVTIITADDKQTQELALIENLQRENLNPLEEAKSYETIIKLSNITQQELAKKIGKSQSFIANKIRLLSLPRKIKEAILNKKISERHARSLMTVKNEEEQIYLLERVIEDKLTVKELDNLINQKTITDKEIKNAIADIMKTLNINEEIEEEKESDNMNDGNFFPNFNNQQVPNNNISLNTMNNQSMQTPPISPMPEMVMPTPTPVANNIMPNQPIDPVGISQFPQPEPNIISNPLPQEEISVPPTMNIETPVMEETPLFNPNLNIPPQVNQPITEPINQPEIIQPLQEEMPVENIQSFTPSNTEIPVFEEQPNQNDKLTKTLSLLDQSNINYKLYSNDENYCIIIEV